MSDDTKVNPDNSPEEKSEELTPQEQEQVSGGAPDAFIMLTGTKGESSGGG